MDRDNLYDNQMLASSSAAIENIFTQPQTDYNLNNMGMNINSANINSIILDFFANKLHPISILKDGLFKHLVQPILLSAKVELNEVNVLHHILKTSIHIKEAIRIRIKQSMFALKIDLIVGANITVMGIHIQQALGKEVHLYTLSLQQIRNDTTVAEIRIMILEVLYCYKININQILITTTDINVLPKEKNHSEVARMVNYFNLACNDFLNFVGSTRTIPATRLIQKCIRRVLNNSELESNLVICNDIVQKYNMNIMKADKGCKLYFTLKPPFNCWKSALEMVNSFFEIRASHFQHNENLQFTVTSEQALFLEDFVKIFHTIQKLTIKLEDSVALPNNTFSNLYVVLMELKLIVKKTTRTKLQAIFLDELEKSFGLIMKDRIFLSSIYLDPRIRICLGTTQTNEVKILLSNLYKKMQILRNKRKCESHSSNLSSKSSMANNSPFQEYLESLETSRPQEIEQRRLNLDLSCYELECSNRFPMETNIFEFWWSKQNCLSELANAIQAIPITQVTMERNLLAYNYVQSNHLILSEVENILLIKFNCQFQCN